MYKVMIRDNMSLIAKEILEASGDFEIVIDNNKITNDPKALAEIIGTVHGLAVRSGTRITEAVLEKATRLKVIGRAGIGVDNIDVQAATRKGVVVMNAPGGNTVTTAEHTISLMMALARNIPQATASLRAGKWEKKLLSGVEISGKVLGIIGLGQIGRIVAKRSKGLKMNVIASDPYISRDAAKALEVKLVSLDELFEHSDFITLHVPAIKETLNMINTSSISKMKSGVRIINCSRGEIVNIDDLYQAVESGHVAGAALDVFPTEPPDPTLPIFQHPNIIFTPHLGASTDEAQSKVAEMIGRQMADYLTNDIITNAVNFPSVSKEVMEKIRPHIELAKKMGSLMGQFVRNIHDITVTYSGEMADLETRPLTNAVLKGFLDSFTHIPVNYVNARTIANEKGINLKETTSRAKDDFAGLIKVKLDGVSKENPDEIWGTIFGKIYPRIVRLGKIYMDAIPEGFMLVVQNYDRPGVIGNLGNLLGNHNINIGRFQLGRRDERALCMINIDTPADESTINEILKLPNIISVKQVHLE